MKFTTVVTALSLALTVSASPLSVQKRSANIVKTNRRPQFRVKDANSATPVFDAAAAQNERARIRTKYGNGAHYRKRMAEGPSTRKAKRVERIDPFDINQSRQQKRQAAGTGEDSLDNADDVCEWALSCRLTSHEITTMLPP